MLGSELRGHVLRICLRDITNLLQQPASHCLANAAQEHNGGLIMEDKLALVTGASSGIGLELAKELASRGYDVVIASAGERLSGAADEIRGR
jgi:hypothetical protein